MIPVRIIALALVGSRIAARYIGMSPNGLTAVVLVLMLCGMYYLNARRKRK